MYGVGMDDTVVKIRGAPVLDEPALSAHQKMIADKLTIAELMSMAVVALPPLVVVLFPLVSRMSGFAYVHRASAVVLADR